MAFDRIARSCWVGVLVFVLFGAAAGAGAGPKEDAEAGERAYLAGDLIGAMANYRKAANAGYAPAQARLADFLDAADEDVQAVALYSDAVAQGDAHGQFGLGSMYLKGEGAPKDIDAARKLILAAADQNYPPAVEFVVKVFRSGGLGLLPDPEKVAAWEARAQKLGIVVPLPAQPKPIKK